MKLKPRLEGALLAHADGSPFTRKVLLPAARFVRVEEIAGGPLVVAAVCGLVWANTAHESYEGFWGSKIAIDAWSWSHAATLRTWINELLLPIFFFVAGLELKREIRHGALSTPRRAALPVALAIGGMVVPALFYLGANLGPDGVPGGWGVPLATDIAFALSILALAGDRVPTTLKILVLAFAAIDDVGGVLVIAVVYSHGGSPAALVVAAALLAGVFLLKRVGVRQLFPYWLFGGAFCAALVAGGVHPTVGGIVLGLMAPAVPFFGRNEMAGATRALANELADLERRLGDFEEDESEDAERQRAATLGLLEALAVGSEPITERLSRQVNPWVSYVILPTFALANAGVPLDVAAVQTAATDPAAQGIVAGLVLGKPIGFLLAAWLAITLGLAEKPGDVTWAHLTAAGLLAGVGFTVSLFIGDLAFADAESVRRESVKVAILSASALSAALGLGTALWSRRA